jgi:hypothetical protein
MRSTFAQAEKNCALVRGLRSVNPAITENEIGRVLGFGRAKVNYYLLRYPRDGGESLKWFKTFSQACAQLKVGNRKTAAQSFTDLAQELLAYDCEKPLARGNGHPVHSGNLRDRV